jgi:hypothetical protein
MTDRDEFAKAALTGWLATISETRLEAHITSTHMRQTAEFCYRFADAMINARRARSDVTRAHLSLENQVRECGDRECPTCADITMVLSGDKR